MTLPRGGEAVEAGKDLLGTRGGAEDDLRALFGKSTAVLVSLAGPLHVVESANPALFATVGEDRARTRAAIAELRFWTDGRCIERLTRRRSSSRCCSPIPTAGTCRRAGGPDARRRCRADRRTVPGALPARRDGRVHRSGRLHVEEALLNVRSVFIASGELGGLVAYLHR